VVTFENVEANELLPERVLDCLPRECECGGEIAFTDTLKQIFCLNPMCIYKIAARLEDMAKAMQVDDFGNSTCVELVKTWQLKSPYQIFLVGELRDKGQQWTADVSALDKKMRAICNPEKRRVQLWEMVKYGAIPNMDKTAQKIFGGYNSIKEAYTDIEAGQVPFIAEKLGIKSNEAGVMAFKIYQILKAYKQELEFAESRFQIYKPEGIALSIACTESVDGYKNKAAFINALNLKFDGSIHATLAPSVTRDVHALVADGGTGHRKYRDAIKINEKYLAHGLANGLFTQDEVGTYKSEKDLFRVGEKIIIGTSAELVKTLERVFL
jgi:hypothetical protein